MVTWTRDTDTDNLVAGSCVWFQHIFYRELAGDVPDIRSIVERTGCASRGSHHFSVEFYGMVVQPIRADLILNL